MTSLGAENVLRRILSRCASGKKVYVFDSNEDFQ